MLYTFIDTRNGEAHEIEGDVAPAAVLKLEQENPVLFAYCTFNGTPAHEWLNMARQMFAPA